MGWLADGDVNFTYKRAITLKGQAGCPTDYDVKVIVTNNGAPIEYSATGWTVNSKTGHYRIPFTVTEPDGIARTSGLQFDIPVDIGWLRHERYIPATADGDEFEFADADGVCCKYWYDNAMIQPNAPLNYSVVDITVKIPVTASQVKQMYLYFDPSWGTTANFSKADTFMVYSAAVAAATDDCRVYWTTSYQFSTGGNFWGFGSYINHGYHSSARFLNVGNSIAQDAEIVEAYLRLVANGAFTGTTIGYLVGEDVDNAATYNGLTYAAWLTRHSSPNLTNAITTIYNEEPFTDGEVIYWECRDIIQEIVNRSGFASGSAVGITAMDNGTATNVGRDGHSWDAHSGTDATQLTIVARIKTTNPRVVNIAFCHASLLNHATNPPNDIRFTLYDGTTVLTPKFLPRESDSDTFVFSVPIPDLSSDVTIWCYYGHATASLLTSANYFVTANKKLFQDFTDETLDAVPTGVTVESGTWVTKNEGLWSDRFSPDGCWNNMGYKVSSKKHVMFTASNWRNTTGLVIAKSIDGLNFKHRGYYKLPWNAGNQWLIHWYLESGVHYGVFEACFQENYGSGAFPYGALRLFMTTATDPSDPTTYTPPVCIYQNSAIPSVYAPFLTKFGSTYYVYCVRSGYLYILTSSSVTGPYVNSGYTLTLAGETPSVFYQASDSKYYVLFSRIATMTLNYISADDKYFQVNPSASSALTYDRAPYWASADRFGGRMIYNVNDSRYEIYFSGTRNVNGANSGEGVLGFCHKAALGAGNWTMVDKKALWCTVDPAGTSLVRLSTLGTMADLVIQVPLKGTEASTNVQIRWRCALDDSAYYYAYVKASDDKLYLGKYTTGGGDANITSVTLPWATNWGAVPNVIKDIEVRHHGHFISVYVNGWPAILAQHDDTITDAGYVKIACVAEKGMVKEILVRPYITDGAGLVEPLFLSAGNEAQSIDVTASDGIKMGDSVAPALSVLASDGLKLGDTPSSLVKPMPIASDGLVLGDSTAPLTKLFPLASDGLVMGDAISALVALNAAVSDGLILGDLATIIRAVSTVYLYASDGLVFGDSAAPSVQLSPATQDGLKMGDLPSAMARLQALLQDGLKVGDTPSAVVMSSPSLVDGLKLGDMVSVAISLNIIAQDGLRMGELLTALVRLEATAQDGVVFGDQSVAVAALVHILYLYLTDGLVLGDAVRLGATAAGLVTLSRALLSTVTMSESQPTSVALSDSALTSVSMSDAILEV